MAHKNIYIKTVSITFLFIFIITALFSQNIKYSLTVNSNYGFFSQSTKETIPNSVIVGSTSSGYSFYEYSGYIKLKSKPKMGFSIMNNLIIKLNKYFSVLNGIGFQFLHLNKSYDIENDVNNYYSYLGISAPEIIIIGDSEKNYNIISVEIPIEIQLNLIKNKLLIYSGISSSILLNKQNEKINNYYYNEQYFNNGYINMIFGIKNKLYKNIYANYSFCRSFTNVENYSDSNTKIRINNISIGLTYKF